MSLGRLTLAGSALAGGLAVHTVVNLRHLRRPDAEGPAIAERVSDALSGHLLLQQLQESEQRYRTVFENTHDAIIVHDFQGAIQAVNQTMLALYGLESVSYTHLTLPTNREV